MYYHYRKHWMRYSKLRKADGKTSACPFCDGNEIKDRIVFESEHTYVIRNRIPYDHWELRPVSEHLLLIPKRHIQKLHELTDIERTDLSAVMAKYDDLNYEIYMRATNSVQRSVGHQHTHLIKTEAKRGRGMIFVLKPYILWRLP